jgi:hypothetical protein
MNPHNIQVCAEVRPELTLEAGRPVSCARRQASRTGPEARRTGSQANKTCTNNQHGID